MKVAKEFKIKKKLHWNNLDFSLFLPLKIFEIKTLLNSIYFLFIR